MKIYVDLTFRTEIDVEPEDYGVNTEDQLASALNHSSEAHEHVPIENIPVEVTDMVFVPTADEILEADFVLNFGPLS